MRYTPLNSYNAVNLIFMARFLFAQQKLQQVSIQIEFVQTQLINVITL